jgi:hypothetical protein
LIGRQDKFTTTAFTVKDLLVERLAMSADGCHGDQEILFVGTTWLCHTKSLITGTILTKERLPVRREAHPSATFGTHETFNIRGAQALGRER